MKKMSLGESKVQVERDLRWEKGSEEPKVGYWGTVGG